MFVLVVFPMCDTTSTAGKEGAPTGMSPSSAENRQGPGITERGTRVRGQEGAQETKGSLDSQDEGRLVWKKREREEKIWKSSVYRVWERTKSKGWVVLVGWQEKERRKDKK